MPRSSVILQQLPVYLRKSHTKEKGKKLKPVRITSWDDAYAGALKMTIAAYEKANPGSDLFAVYERELKAAKTKMERRLYVACMADLILDEAKQPDTTRLWIAQLAAFDEADGKHYSLPARVLAWIARDCPELQTRTWAAAYLARCVQEAPEACRVDQLHKALLTAPSFSQYPGMEGVIFAVSYGYRVLMNRFPKHFAAANSFSWENKTTGCADATLSQLKALIEGLRKSAPPIEKGFLTRFFGLGFKDPVDPEKEHAKGADACPLCGLYSHEAWEQDGIALKACLDTVATLASTKDFHADKTRTPVGYVPAKTFHDSVTTPVKQKAEQVLKTVTQKFIVHARYQTYRANIYDYERGVRRFLSTAGDLQDFGGTSSLEVKRRLDVDIAKLEALKRADSLQNTALLQPLVDHLLLPEVRTLLGALDPVERAGLRRRLLAPFTQHSFASSSKTAVDYLQKEVMPRHLLPGERKPSPLFEDLFKPAGAPASHDFGEDLRIAQEFLPFFMLLKSMHANGWQKLNALVAELLALPAEKAAELHIRADAPGSIAQLCNAEKMADLDKRFKELHGDASFPTSTAPHTKEQTCALCVKKHALTQAAPGFKGLNLGLLLAVVNAFSTTKTVMDIKFHLADGAKREALAEWFLAGGDYNTLAGAADDIAVDTTKLLGKEGGKVIQALKIAGPVFAGVGIGLGLVDLSESMRTDNVIGSVIASVGVAFTTWGLLLVVNVPVPDPADLVLVPAGIFFALVGLVLMAFNWLNNAVGNTDTYKMLNRLKYYDDEWATLSTLISKRVFFEREADGRWTLVCVWPAKTATMTLRCYENDEFNPEDDITVDGQTTLKLSVPEDTRWSFDVVPEKDESFGKFSCGFSVYRFPKKKMDSFTKSISVGGIGGIRESNDLVDFYADLGAKDWTDYYRSYDDGIWEIQLKQVGGAWEIYDCYLARSGDLKIKKLAKKIEGRTHAPEWSMFLEWPRKNVDLYFQCSEDDWVNNDEFYPASGSKKVTTRLVPMNGVGYLFTDEDWKALTAGFKAQQESGVVQLLVYAAENEDLKNPLHWNWDITVDASGNPLKATRKYQKRLRFIEGKDKQGNKKWWLSLDWDERTTEVYLEPWEGDNSSSKIGRIFKVEIDNYRGRYDTDLLKTDLKNADKNSDDQVEFFVIANEKKELWYPTGVYSRWDNFDQGNRLTKQWASAEWLISVEADGKVKLATQNK